jgi:hypothetical protein
MFTKASTWKERRRCAIRSAFSTSLTVANPIFSPLPPPLSIHETIFSNVAYPRFGAQLPIQIGLWQMNDEWWLGAKVDHDRRRETGIPVVLDMICIPPREMGMSSVSTPIVRFEIYKLRTFILTKWSLPCILNQFITRIIIRNPNRTQERKFMKA